MRLPFKSGLTEQFVGCESHEVNELEIYKTFAPCEYA
jgi:hypothetical protein